MAYADDLRPPGTVPNAWSVPRWPILNGREVPPQTNKDQPISLDPPGGAERPRAAPEDYDFRRPYGGSAAAAGLPGNACRAAHSPARARGCRFTACAWARAAALCSGFSGPFGHWFGNAGSRQSARHPGLSDRVGARPLDHNLSSLRRSAGFVNR